MAGFPADRAFPGGFRCDLKFLLHRNGRIGTSLFIVTGLTTFTTTANVLHGECGMGAGAGMLGSRKLKLWLCLCKTKQLVKRLLTDAVSAKQCCWLFLETAIWLSLFWLSSLSAKKRQGDNS